MSKPCARCGSPCPNPASHTANGLPIYGECVRIMTNNHYTENKESQDGIQHVSER